MSNLNEKLYSVKTPVQLQSEKDQSNISDNNNRRLGAAALGTAGLGYLGYKIGSITPENAGHAVGSTAKVVTDAVPAVVEKIGDVASGGIDLSKLVIQKTGEGLKDFKDGIVQGFTQGDTPITESTRYMNTLEEDTDWKTTLKNKIKNNPGLVILGTAGAGAAAHQLMRLHNQKDLITKEPGSAFTDVPDYVKDVHGEIPGFVEKVQRKMLDQISNAQGDTPITESTLIIPRSTLSYMNTLEEDIDWNALKNKAKDNAGLLIGGIGTGVAGAIGMHGEAVEMGTTPDPLAVAALGGTIIGTAGAGTGYAIHQMIKSNTEDGKAFREYKKMNEMPKMSPMSSDFKY